MMTTPNESIEDVVATSSNHDQTRHHIETMDKSRPEPMPVMFIGVPTKLLQGFNLEQKSLIKRPLRTANIRSILGKSFSGYFY